MVNRREAPTVIIVGAGPSGLATAACLDHYSIPSIILEKEDCHSSLWKKRAYDRLNLHLAKEFSSLPHMPHPPEVPTFIPRKSFVAYLDRYVDHFGLRPLFRRSVETAAYDEAAGAWTVLARNTETEKVEKYVGRYLVVATGENGKGYIPELPGLDSFAGGEVVHSSEFKSGGKYAGQRVLVVGCGNSGMEIALDLCNHGALTSIVIRNPFHVVTREMVHMGMLLLKYGAPVWVVDGLVLLLSNYKFGDLSSYGIVKPDKGPFAIKFEQGRAPVIDVGTVAKIKAGEIQVVPGISTVEGKQVLFVDGKSHHFDAIVFATGFKSTANWWLKDDHHLLNEEGMPKKAFPNHWKGESGLYCAGLSRRGLAGVSMDAQNIANHIEKDLAAANSDVVST